MTAPLFNPDEFCRTCRGAKGVREPSARDPRITVWSPCYDCGGSGWRPGAQVAPGRAIGDIDKEIVGAAIAPAERKA